MTGQQALSAKSKQQLWMLLGVLVILVSIWLALIVSVPVLIVKHSPPSFAFDGRLNRISMVLRLSGSHAWGTPVSDAFCVDLATG